MVLATHSGFGGPVDIADSTALLAGEHDAHVRVYSALHGVRRHKCTPSGGYGSRSVDHGMGLEGLSACYELLTGNHDADAPVAQRHGMIKP